MSHAKNKVVWCLRKAEKELKETGKHRGLIKINPDKEKTTTSTDVREEYQYGTKLSLDDKTYKELLELTQIILAEAKETVEKE